ncbi:MAG: hypothetical protein WCO35_03740 [Candidatus Nomurabacteria bacterium]
MKKMCFILSLLIVTLSVFGQKEVISLNKALASKDRIVQRSDSTVTTYKVRHFLGWTMFKAVSVQQIDKPDALLITTNTVKSVNDSLKNVSVKSDTVNSVSASLVSVQNYVSSNKNEESYTIYKQGKIYSIKNGVKKETKPVDFIDETKIKESLELGPNLEIRKFPNNRGGFDCYYYDNNGNRVTI